MKVYLYTTTKRNNSTKIPTGGVEVDAVLKDATSILTPTLYFNRAAVSHEYNYCYIPDFGRYYHKTDIVYNGSQVVYSFAVDPLASFKNVIGASSQYVLRSSAKSNGTIIDSKYPITCEYTLEAATIKNPFSEDMTTTGCFSVGIVGSGTTQYYLFTPGAFAPFMQMISTDVYAGMLLGNSFITTFPQYKAIINGLDYISSITWLPFFPASDCYETIPAATGFDVGAVHFDTQVFRVIKPVQPRAISFGALKKHPLTAVRGEYVNAPPFTRINMFIPFFGQFEISSADLIGMTDLAITMLIDIRVGTSSLTIQATNGTVSKILSRLSGAVGIPVQVSAVRVGGVGIPQILSTALTTVAGMAANPAGGIVGGIQAIGDLAQNYIPSVSTIGNTGGMDGMRGNYRLEYTFYNPVDDDNSQYGRPLCEVTRIDTIPGFIMCSNVELEVNATFDEQQQIKNYMESGFFYE